MKRKLPVLIAIAVTIIILLAACQPHNQPASGGQTTPAPVQTNPPAPTEQTTVPVTEPVQTQPVDTPPADTTLPAEPKQLTKEEAMDIALKDAGFAKADVTGLHAELDRDDGTVHYDVEFYKDGKEYDYEIHAETGKILEPVKKAADSNTTNTETTKPKTETAKQLTKDQAISKALSHAGLKKSQVSKLKAELDKDDGVKVYEVEFETADYEYDYEIHATSGKILKSEKERND